MNNRYHKIRQCIRYSLVGRSFFSPDFKNPHRLGDGLESWCGFYQSIRPTQMGLSLNIGMCISIFLSIIVNLLYVKFPTLCSLDMSSAAFIEPLPVIEFVAQLLGKDVLLRPFSDSNHVKVLSCFWDLLQIRYWFSCYLCY